MTMRERAWVVEAVRFFRRLDFFQNRTDHGHVNVLVPSQDFQPDPSSEKMPYALTSLRLPAYVFMAEEEIADLILQDFLKRWQTVKYDPDGQEGDLNVLEYDPFRMVMMEPDGIEPGGTSYVGALEAIVRVSRGSFIPTHIRESWEGLSKYGSPVRLEFAFQGRRYEIELQNWGENMDMSFVGAANELLSRADSPYQFYHCGGEVLSFWFAALTPDEKQQLERKRGWHIREMESRAKLIDKGKAP